MLSKMQTFKDNPVKHGVNHYYKWVFNHRFSWLLFVIVIGLSLDQTSKIWAQATLAELYEVSEEQIVDNEATIVNRMVHYPIRVIEAVPHVMNFIYKENPAAAFSLTRSLPSWFRRPMLICVSLLATIFFLVWYFRMKEADGLLLSSFSFILAGAIGNLIDRLRLGYVIDFLDVHAELLGYPHWHWPTFNIADSFIVVGAVGVVFRTIWPLQKIVEKNLSVTHTS